MAVNEEFEEDHKFQVLEQLGVAQQTKEDLKDILDKHQGFSRRAVIETLKGNGVDMKLYHEGMIIGNHCFEFAKNGNKIMNELTTKMKDEMKELDDTVANNSLKTSLDKFEILMSDVINKWYVVICFIKSIKCHSDEEIVKYKADIDDLKAAIVKLIGKEPPLADNPLKYPTSPKTHLLFGKDSIRFLEHWGTFGGVDEENIESVHAVFNQLKRRYCGTRGKKQKKLVFEQFLFNGAKFIRAGIDDIKEGTRAKNPAKTIAKKKVVADSADAMEETEPNILSALDEFDATGLGKVDWEIGRAHV